MIKVCIRGNEDHPEKVIEFLESLGIKNKWNWSLSYAKMFYFADKDGDMDSSELKPDDYTEISFEDACAILDDKADLSHDGTVYHKLGCIARYRREKPTLNDDCTVSYKSELPKFPCEMWVWDDYKDKAALREIHAYAPTLEFGWIGRMAAWKNASLTDPRIEETITIEEAEKRLNVKIRR